MAISKRFHRSGKTSNHGMQIVDTDFKRRMLEEKFEQETSSGILCGNGCEFSIIGEALTTQESIKLGEYIHDNNLCPFCKKKNGKIDFQYCVENQDKMQQFMFVMDDKRYDVMYKPEGYRFLPPLEEDE